MLAVSDRLPTLDSILQTLVQRLGVDAGYIAVTQTNEPSHSQEACGVENNAEEKEGSAKKKKRKRAAELCEEKKGS